MTTHVAPRLALTPEELTFQGKFSKWGMKPLRPVMTFSTNFGLQIHSVGVYRNDSILITRTLSPCCSMETTDRADDDNFMCPACIAPLPGHGITAGEDGFLDEDFIQAMQALGSMTLDPLLATLAARRLANLLAEHFLQDGILRWHDFPPRPLA